MSDIHAELDIERIQTPDEIVSMTGTGRACRYPEAICDQLRWLHRRVFYQYMQTGCPTIDLQANLSITHNRADLAKRLAVPAPILCTMPAIRRGSVQHSHPKTDDRSEVAP